MQTRMIEVNEIRPGDMLLGLIKNEVDDLDCDIVRFVIGISFNSKFRYGQTWTTKTKISFLSISPVAIDVCGHVGEQRYSSGWCRAL